MSKRAGDSLRCQSWWKVSIFRPARMISSLLTKWLPYTLSHSCSLLTSISQVFVTFNYFQPGIYLWYSTIHCHQYSAIMTSYQFRRCRKGLSNTSAISTEIAKPRLIVFGAETSCPSKEFLAEIRKYLLSGTRLGAFLEALKDLPSLWDRLVRHFQLLKAVSGRDTLQRLGDWIQQGELPDGNIAESNLLGMPLTPIIHFVQYIHYLDRNTSHVELV